MKNRYNRSGYEILHDPRLNKGTAFTEKERDMYGLHGLLPSQIETIEQQIIRVNEQVDHFKEPINKYVYLIQMLDNNHTLFFRTIIFLLSTSAFIPSKPSGASSSITL